MKSLLTETKFKSLDDQDLKERFGDDIIYLFKGGAPFVEGPTGAPQGMLIAREEDGKVACNECAPEDIFWGDVLESHVRHAHKMTFPEYKEKHGFRPRQSLCSKKLSQSRREALLRRRKDKKSTMGGSNSEEMAAMRRVPKRYSKFTPQQKNERNTCDAQLTKRENSLVEYLRSCPVATRTNAQEVDSKLVRRILKKYGSWEKFQKHHNIKIPTIRELNGGMSDGELIYELRSYVKKHGDRPWKRGERLRLFPYAEGTYTNRWGSMAKVYAHCGVQKVKNASHTSPAKFELID